MATLGRGTDTHFFYPPASLHVSLVGCTPRYPSPDAFTPDRIDRIERICRASLAGLGPVTLHLSGVGILGNQVFVQVFSPDGAWPAMRLCLQRALLAAGEEPMIHDSPAPIHLNLMRLTDTRPEELARILAIVTGLRDLAFGDLIIHRIEYVLADFLLSTAHTRTIAGIAL